LALHVLEGLTGVSHRERLANAEDRRHLMGQDGVDLGPHERIRLSLVSPPLGVLRDHVGDIQLFKHGCAHLAGEGTLVLVVARLCPKREWNVAFIEGDLHRSKRGERWMDAHFTTWRKMFNAEQRCDSLHELHGLEMVLVHLPVAAHKAAAFLDHW
jgi:hypothetical protein